MVVGVTWFLLNGIAAVRPPTKVFSLSPPEPEALSQQTDVTIPAEGLDRMHLKFAKVTQTPISVEVRVPGTVQPNAYKQVHVTSLAGGVVTQVGVELGQEVKRGQALAQIFSRDLTEAQTAYISISAELEAEHKKLMRTQELVSHGAASRQQLEEIEANHLMHAAHLEEARQKLLLLGLDNQQVADVAAGKQVSTNIAVASPLDGVVTARNVNLGQIVTAAQDLLAVTDLSSVWVEGKLFSKTTGLIRTGWYAGPRSQRRRIRGGSIEG